MRMSLAAVTALAGSLLLPVLLLGSAQAVTSSLDFKNAISSTVTLTPVRGGGGEFAFGGGHMGGGGFGRSYGRIQRPYACMGGG